MKIFAALQLWACRAWHGPSVLEHHQRKTHTLLWRCPVCYRIRSETTLPPNPKLLRDLHHHKQRARLKLVRAGRSDESC
jgi:hypothetical protein